MITFDEAYGIVMANVPRLPAEEVPLDDALGRVLAEDVVSDSDMPPFNKSAMDGYACRRADLANDLCLVETIPAGMTPTCPIGKNECSKIMTGGVVPEGADCVIMVEFTEESGGAVRFTGPETRDNICRKGEDLKRGDIMLEKGARISARHIGVLASAGRARVPVSVRPRVAVIATGDELVEPGSAPGPSKIRNSNSYQLCAQARAMGANAVYHGIAPDTEDAIGDSIAAAMADSNVILVSGGVSAGDFDLVPGMLRKNGFDLLFEKIATKPGMPTVFGRSGDCFCFGLPGNPVSTFVLFELLVKPFLYTMMGHDFRPAVVSQRLTCDITRKKTERDSWIPVRRTDPGEVEPIEYHGSGHLTSLPRADGMICIPRGVSKAAKGTMVDVRQI